MGVPLHWVVQYCSQVRPYKGSFTWADCLSWITLDKFPTKKEADAFMEAEREQRRHSFVGAALRVYPIYPSVTLNKYHVGSNPTRIGYRVGEPQKTDAKKLIEFEVVELGNKHLLVDIGKALGVAPNLESIVKAINDRFGEAEAMWLCDTPEWAEKRYGPGEAYVVQISEEAIIGSDLGPDGKLWIWRKTINPRIEGRKYPYGCPYCRASYKSEFFLGQHISLRHPEKYDEWEKASEKTSNPRKDTLAARKWRLRVKAERLLKEIREEKARIGV